MRSILSAFQKLMSLKQAGSRTEPEPEPFKFEIIEPEPKPLNFGAAEPEPQMLKSLEPEPELHR